MRGEEDEGDERLGPIRYLIDDIGFEGTLKIRG